MDIATLPKKTSITEKLIHKKKTKHKRTKGSLKPHTTKVESPIDSIEMTKEDKGNQKPVTSEKVMSKSTVMENFEERYPALDENLVQRFLSVPMNNNQKGRVRQLLKDKLKGTSDTLLPDVIYSRIQSILKGNANLTDTDLRKVRILHNMLKTAVQNEQKADVTKLKVEKRKLPVEDEEQNVKKEKKEQQVKKVKGKKRYIVFLGNLSLDVDKEKICQHFSDLSDHVVDVRIPKQAEGKKSAIAYVELSNETSYELALSKHHSMLCNKRINVLYSMQKTGKITKNEAKSKSAKLLALQKSGRLIGSVPLNRKRSHRRMKLKQARAKEEQNV